MTDDVLAARHVLARWRANDWRRAFALAEGLDGSLRATCAVADHEPLSDNTGALAMPLLRRLGELDLDDLVQALRPLLEELVRDPADLTPGLAELRDCQLVLDEAQGRAVAAAEQVLADVRARRRADLAGLQAWNDSLR